MAFTEQDKAVRKRRITGTRIGKIVGLHKHGDRLTAWREIMGVDQDEVDPDSEDILRGNFLEEGILRWYAHRTRRIVEPASAIVSAHDDRFAATPDGYSFDSTDTRIIECKAPRFADDWGEDGTDQIPAYHVCQVTWEMMCADVQAADVVALLHGGIRVYTLHRDRSLEAFLVAKADEFWRKYIETGMEPPPGSHSGDYLAKRFPDSGKEIIDADMDSEQLARELLQCKEQIKSLEERKDEAENRLKLAIADNKGVRGDGWRALWTTINRKPKPNWESYARALGGTDEGATVYFETPPSYRRFDFREK